MQLDAKLNFDLIAVEAEDTVHLLLELTAPALDTQRQPARRPPCRWSSIEAARWADARLYAALQAIQSLSSRLRPEDRFGLVTFDDEVAVPVAGRPIGDGSRCRQALTPDRPGRA